MKITFEVKVDLNVMDEVDHIIKQMKKALGSIPFTVTGEHGEDIEQIREKLTDSDHKALDDWINYGGILWTEADGAFPHTIRVYHTDYDMVMISMYETRDKEYADLSEEDYYTLLSVQALIHMGIDPKAYFNCGNIEEIESLQKAYEKLNIQ